MPPMISVLRPFGGMWELTVQGRFEMASHNFDLVMARVGETVIKHRGIATVSITDDYSLATRRAL